MDELDSIIGKFNTFVSSIQKNKDLLSKKLSNLEKEINSLKGKIHQIEANMVTKEQFKKLFSKNVKVKKDKNIFGKIIDSLTEE